ncbi:hypothetical protein P9112_012618 [Eukaryota sp. TZLM1-RC]
MSEPLLFNESPTTSKSSVFGWVSFSLVWNLSNSIVYATLFPRLLEDFTDDSEGYYSLASAATTYIASILLPVLGILTDKSAAVRRYLIVSAFLGLAINFTFPFLDTIPLSNKSIVVIAVLAYVLGMFLLRLAVMCNNALLSSFPSSKRVSLSLLSNLVGFGVALLAFIWFASNNLIHNCHSHRYFSFICKTALYDPSKLSLYVLIFTSCLLPLLILSPKQKGNRYRDTVTFKSVFIGFFSALRQLHVNSDYSTLKRFLYTYLFYSTSGTVMSIFLPTYLTFMFDLDLSERSVPMFLFLASFVVGVFVGMASSKLNKKASLKIDLILLFIQNFLFVVSFGAMYISEWFFSSQSTHFLVVKILSSFIGLLYAWNASLSRACMSRLTPPNEGAFYMGLFSTATYLGIGLVSTFLSLVKKFGLSMRVLPCLLSFVGMPASLSLLLLIRLVGKDFTNIN